MIDEADKIKVIKALQVAEVEALKDIYKEDMKKAIKVEPLSEDNSTVRMFPGLQDALENSEVWHKYGCINPDCECKK